MGYAFFYTDSSTVEYKFLTGIQSADDIEEFGGERYRNFADIDCDGIVAAAEDNMDEADVVHLKADLEDLCETMDDKDNVFDIDRLGTNFWIGLGRMGHHWFHSELSDILTILTTESEELSLALPDWEKYTPDTDGIDSLLKSLFSAADEQIAPPQGGRSALGRSPELTDTAHYALGCVIYLLLKNQPEDEPLCALYDD